MRRTLSFVPLYPALAVACLSYGAAFHAAHAADLPRRQAPPPPLVLPVFTWTGFYAGVNAGYALSEGKSSFTDATYGTVSDAGQGGGFAGGGQIGYNYQLTPGSGLVLGFETDIQGVAQSRANVGTIGTTPYYNVSPSLDYFGTVRGRVGYAFDRVLVYGTGGFAYGGGSTSSYAASYTDTLPSTSRTGYAVGGGLEYAFTEKLSAKAEALYINLAKRSSGSATYDSTVPAYYGTGSSDTGFAVVRAGVNYRF